MRVVRYIGPPYFLYSAYFLTPITSISPPMYMFSTGTGRKGLTFRRHLFAREFFLCRGLAGGQLLSYELS